MKICSEGLYANSAKFEGLLPEVDHFHLYMYAIYYIVCVSI